MSENFLEVFRDYSKCELAYACLFLGACDATAEVSDQFGVAENMLILCSKMNGYHLDTHSPRRFSTDWQGPMV